MFGFYATNHIYVPRAVKECGNLLNSVGDAGFYRLTDGYLGGHYGAYEFLYRIFTEFYSPATVDAGVCVVNTMTGVA